MAESLKVSVISPEKFIFEGEADSLRVPGSDGYFGVLSGHAALVSALDAGILEINYKGKKTKVVIDGGFIEIKANKVNILADGGDLEFDIDLEDSQKALSALDNEPSSMAKATKVKRLKNRILVHQS